MLGGAGVGLGKGGYPDWERSEAGTQGHPGLWRTGAVFPISALLPGLLLTAGFLDFGHILAHIYST